MSVGDIDCNLPLLSPAGETWAEPLRQIELRQMREALDDELRLLSDQERNVFRQRFVEERTLKETAGRLAISVSSISRIEARLRCQFQTSLRRRGLLGSR